MPRDREDQKGLKIALHFLKFRPRSEFEVREKLKQKKISAETIEKIIGEFIENKLLDDARFAKLWVESRMNIKPMGKRLLFLELRKLGIEKDKTETALEEAGYDESAQAKEAAERRFNRYQKYTGQEFFQKMAGFLARRGFDYGTIKETIDELNHNS